MKVNYKNIVLIIIFIFLLLLVLFSYYFKEQKKLLEYKKQSDEMSMSQNLNNYNQCVSEAMKRNRESAHDMYMDMCKCSEEFTIECSSCLIRYTDDEQETVEEWNENDIIACKYRYNIQQ